MASLGFFTSSPAPRMAHQDSVVVISSSPEFPSICDLVPTAPKDSPTRRRTNAPLAPASVPTAPTTTGNSRAIGTGGMEMVEPRKSQDCAAEDSVMEVPPAQVAPKKAARKPRAAKDTAAAQTTLPKGKVTKPAAKGPRAKKKAETTSRHFAQPVPATDKAPELPPEPADNEPVSLEPAMRRRIDWTPPPENAPPPRPLDSSAMKELSSSVMPAGDDVFRTLRDVYGRNTDDVCLVDGGAASTSSTTDILGKRKLIEMVAPAGNKQHTPEASPTKPKAAKKKPRTITELATAAYRQSEPQESPADNPQQGPLLGGLETGGESATAGKGPAAKAKAAKRPSRAKPKPSKKREEPRKPVLLSPTSAMRQVARQEFVFGTASQLAIEDDPELLRALHEAMKVSNQPDTDPFASSSPAPNSTLAIRRRPGTGLWAAAARGEEGELLEVLDLTRSSPLPRAQVVSTVPAGSQPATAGKPPTRAFIEIELSDDSLELNNSPPVGQSRQLPAPAARLSSPKTTPRGFGFSGPVLPRNAAPEADILPPPSNQEQHQLLLLSESSSPSPQSQRQELPPQPNFELYTDARLAKEVASYGFKAVKKRTAMIALLGQCWESQHKTGLGARTAQATMATTSAPQAAARSPAKGRPRKNSAASATEAAPAKPRGRKAASVSDAESEAPAVEKRPRGRPRKNSVESAVPDAVESAATPKRGRKKSPSASDAEREPSPQPEKRPRGRPRKDAVAPAAAPKRGRKKSPSPSDAERESSPQATKRPRGRPKKDASPPPTKRSRATTTKPPKSPSKPLPTTPRRRKPSPRKPTSIIEIPDSDSDPFASTPPSSPGEIFSPGGSPTTGAPDLSVTENTETSLLASPTTQQVSLFGYITRAVVGAERSADGAEPSWHERMLMYDPVILEELTAWLNAGQLDKVGYEGEVGAGDVKRWCESKSVCCLWKVNLRGKERKRF